MGQGQLAAARCGACCRPLVWTLVVIWALATAPTARAGKLNCQHIQNNKTCIFNVSFAEGDLLIDEPHFDVLITGAKVTLLATTGTLEIRAGGRVGVDEGAAVESRSGDVRISAPGGLEVSSGGRVAAGTSAAPGRGQLSLQVGVTVVKDASLSASADLKLNATGSVHVEGGQASVECRYGDLSVVAAGGFKASGGSRLLAGSSSDLAEARGRLLLEVGGVGAWRGAVGAEPPRLLGAPPEVSLESAVLVAHMDLQIRATGKVQLHGNQSLVESMLGNVVIAADGSVEVFDLGRVAAGMAAGAEKGSGNVTITAGCGHGALAAASSGGSAEVSVTSQAGVFAKSFMSIAASKVTVGSGVQLNASQGSVALGAAAGCSCTDSLYVGGPSAPSSVTASSVYLTCSSPQLTVDRGVTITAGGAELAVQNDKGSVMLLGGPGPAGLMAQSLRVSAAGDVTINATITGSKGSASLSSLAVNAKGTVLLLPSAAGQWILSAALIYGKVVSIGVPLLYVTGGSSCGNKPVQGDICRLLFDNGTATEAALASLARGPWRAAGAESGLSTNVTFDFMAVASGSLQVAGDAKIKASSLLLCSNGDLAFEAGASLDVSGRGCGPAQGAGSGGVLPVEAKCGSGGGSHVAYGGFGGSFDVRKVKACAPPGEIYERPALGPQAEPPFLPSSGASGGGCTGYNNTQACSRLPSSTSAAGGLVWLSARGALTVQTHLSVLANGRAGAEVQVNSTTNLTTASGGGSGGTVFLFADSLKLTALDPKQPAIYAEAKGGDIGCSRFFNTGTGAVGGAGAGGFVGFEVAQPVAFTENWTQIIYGGGGISTASQDCGIPKLGIETGLGRPGLAAPLKPCDAGRYGLLCLPCPNGTWSAAGALSCRACENKPSTNAFYPFDVTGNPSADCPYLCEPSVPAVKSNPDCLNTFDYIFEFYGGRAGVIVLSIVLGIFCIFLICRRFSRQRCRGGGGSRSFGRGGFQPDDEGSSRVAQLTRYLWTCLVVAGGAQRHSGQVQSSPFHFPREHLANHLFRLYLHGGNRHSSRWTLDREVPESAKALVLESRWLDLAAEIQRQGRVSGLERLLEGLLKWLYPPLAPLWSRRCRQARARKICAFVKGLSSGDVRREFWKPLRARMSSPSEGLGLSFGCDFGATVGYLDFFDYSRRQLDYHVDLQDWAYVLPVHGYGTFDEPYEIDCGDPLVWHLTACHIGRCAICSVVSTFNQVSRVLTHQELDQDTPMMVTLQEAVRRCTERMEELHGSAMVLSIGMTYQKPQQGLMDSGVMSTGLDGSTASFADLARPMHPVPRGISGASVGAGSQQGRSIYSNVGLGLAFANVPALAEPRFPGEPLPTYSTAAVQGTLVTPLRTAELREQIQRTFDAGSQASHGVSIPPQERLFRYLSCRMRPVLPRFLEWLRPDTILLAVTLVGFIDALFFVVFMYMFFITYNKWTFVYLMVPPLVEPAGVALGVLFVVTEYPSLGRTYASFTFFSIFTITLGTICFLIGSNTAWVFWTLQWLLRCTIKLFLFVVANMHINNLMVIWDHNYLEMEPCEFATEVLRDDAARQPHCGSIASAPGTAVSFGAPRSRTSIALDDLDGRGYGAGGPEALQVQSGSRSPEGMRAQFGGGFSRLDAMMATESYPGPQRHARLEVRLPSTGPSSPEPSPF